MLVRPPRQQEYEKHQQERREQRQQQRAQEQAGQNAIVDVNEDENEDEDEDEAPAPHVIASFHPVFTYPIFGDRQEISGYKGLRIGVQFASHDLRPHLQLEWRERHASVTPGSEPDVEHVLADWLHPGKLFFSFFFFSPLFFFSIFENLKKSLSPFQCMIFFVFLLLVWLVFFPFSLSSKPLIRFSQ
jgi:hypothetical protein